MNTAPQAQLDIATARVSHGFREPNDTPTVPGNDSLLRELIGTHAFRRLKEIHFLGAIDYRLIPRPNGKRGATRYSRYEHSLGVMRLAHLYSTSQEMQSANRRVVCVAALLHDIGHPPLSHSMEPVFKEKFGIEHHRATEDIICGRVSLGKDVFSTLRSHDMDIEKLMAVISGEFSGFDGFFHGPINFDTIEGILRSYTYMRQAPTIPSPDTVTEAAIRRTDRKDRDIVDEFWSYKGWVYKHIVNSREGVLSDFACQLFLRRSIEYIGLDCYFGTETELFRRLPGLRELLTSHTFEDEMIRMLDEPVHYRDRNYYIDRDGDFFARRDGIRYRHSRTDRLLELKDTPRLVAAETENEQQGAFFDDNTL